MCPGARAPLPRPAAMCPRGKARPRPAVTRPGAKTSSPVFSVSPCESGGQPVGARGRVPRGRAPWPGQAAGSPPSPGAVRAQRARRANHPLPPSPTRGRGAKGRWGRRAGKLEIGGQQAAGSRWDKHAPHAARGAHGRALLNLPYGQGAGAPPRGEAREVARGGANARERGILALPAPRTQRHREPGAIWSRLRASGRVPRGLPRAALTLSPAPS